MGTDIQAYRQALVLNGMSPEVVNAMPESKVMAEYTKRDLHLVEELSKYNNWGRFDGYDASSGCVKTDSLPKAEDFVSRDALVAFFDKFSESEIELATNKCVQARNHEIDIENRKGYEQHKQKLADYQAAQEKISELKTKLEQGGLSYEEIDKIHAEIKSLEALPVPSPTFKPAPHVSKENINSIEKYIELLKLKPESFEDEVSETIRKLVDSGDFTEEFGKEILNVLISQGKEVSVAKITTFIAELSLVSSAPGIRPFLYFQDNLEKQLNGDSE